MDKFEIAQLGGVWTLECSRSASSGLLSESELHRLENSPNIQIKNIYIYIYFIYISFFTYMNGYKKTTYTEIYRLSIDVWALGHCSAWGGVNIYRNIYIYISIYIHFFTYIKWM